MVMMFEPSYLSLYNSGELERRAEALEARLASCDICPRECGVNRLNGELGFCNSGALPIVDTVCPHHGEEPPLSGTKGSGTVFFGNCNMRCVYCQNYQISQNRSRMSGKEMSCKNLAEKLIWLQDEIGCHNINFVSPSHFVPQILRTLLYAIPKGLKIPLVYNTGGYDSPETIKVLDGIFDIYLPDIRYADDELADKYSQAWKNPGRQLKRCTGRWEIWLWMIMALHSGD
jgi:putative pyruvate formate lyase activating enzyme